MSLKNNLILGLVTLGICLIGLLFIQTTSLHDIPYKPYCLQIIERNVNICIYCKLTYQEDKVYVGEKPSTVITSQQPFKVFGVNGQTKLKCSDYVSLVEKTLPPTQTSKIQFKKTKQVQRIVKQASLKQIQTQQGLPKQLIIDPKYYQSFIVLQVTQALSMNIQVQQLFKDQNTPLLSIVLAFSGIITLIIVCILYYGLSNAPSISILANVAVLLLVLGISQQKDYPTIDNYQYPAALFFVLCLVKVNSNGLVCLGMLFCLIVGYEYDNDTITGASYLACWFIFLWNGWNDIRYNKIFYYTGLSMLIYIGAHTYRVTRNLNQIEYYEVLKLIQIVILTISTTFLETVNERIVEQFVQFKNKQNPANTQTQSFQQSQQMEIEHAQPADDMQ